MPRQSALVTYGVVIAAVIAALATIAAAYIGSSRTRGSLSTIPAQPVTTSATNGSGAGDTTVGTVNSGASNPVSVINQGGSVTINPPNAVAPQIPKPSDPPKSAAGNNNKTPPVDATLAGEQRANINVATLFYRIQFNGVKEQIVDSGLPEASRLVEIIEVQHNNNLNAIAHGDFISSRAAVDQVNKAIVSRWQSAYGPLPMYQHEPPDPSAVCNQFLPGSPNYVKCKADFRNALPPENKLLIP